MVAKREANLIRSRKRLMTTDKKVMALHKALMATHKANSVGQMGGLLNDALSSYLKLAWTRIFFNSASSLNARTKMNRDFVIYTAPLNFDNQQVGEITFARTGQNDFTKEQKEFLHQIAEGVSLAISRLTKHEQAEGLKQQWEATFDAITDPICLIDEHWIIQRTNKAFAQACQSPYENLIGRHLCDELPRSDNHSLPLDRDAQFRIQKKIDGVERTFDVSIQAPMANEGETPIRLVLMRDITDQLRLERQILESAKMAEIGMIGSSIAHELNNPLGGMLSFIQLIKMDCSKEEPIYQDIEEMEKATYKCKEIIENLLGFSRRHSGEEHVMIDLREVIQQSIKITELQTRSRGIKTELQLPDHPVEILGQFNLISQALCNLLQNSYDAIYEIIRSQPRYVGKITIVVREHKKRVELEILDNGIGISSEDLGKVFNPLFTTKNRPSNSGLGLTVAYKIIAEHQGST
jgi:signal transduction histidine kinase